MEWLFVPWLGYEWTIGLFAVGIGLALRALHTTWSHERKLVAVSLVGVIVLGLVMVLGTAHYAFPPISPILLAMGLVFCVLLFALGIERWQLPVPSKPELEALLGQGLRSASHPASHRVRLTDREYELAVDHIRVEQEKLGSLLPPERVRLLAEVARYMPRSRSN